MKDHFGKTFPITTPLLTGAALLICAVRLEAAAAEPPFLLPEPTSESLDSHRLPTTRFAEWGPGLDSEQYEHDWIRLIACYSTWTQPMIRHRVFTPGMVAGTWTGRFFVSRCLAYIVPAFTYVFLQGGSLGAICSHSLTTVRRRFSTGSCISSTDAFLYAVCTSSTSFDQEPYHLRPSANIIFSTILKRLITTTSLGTSKARASSMLGFLEISTQITFRYAPILYSSCSTHHSDRPQSILEHFDVHLQAHYQTHDPIAAARRILDDEYRRTGLYNDGVYDIIVTAQVRAKNIGYITFSRRPCL